MPSAGWPLAVTGRTRQRPVAGHVDAPVLQHRGRHGDPDVLGEQPYQDLEVGSFEGAGQLGCEAAFGRSVRLAREPAAA